jgi:ketosteroid isomerase-like protein
MTTLSIDTPETQEAVERWRQGKINIFDEMARLERERDEARRSLEHITEYGTEEINIAVDLRQRLATALVERDEAREALKIKQ